MSDSNRPWRTARPPRSTWVEVMAVIKAKAVFGGDGQMEKWELSDGSLLSPDTFSVWRERSVEPDWKVEVKE